MKYRVLMAVMLCAAILAGCSEKKADLSRVTESTVGVNGDGSVDEVIIESFEESYYSLDELTAYIQEQIDAFNTDNPQEQPENQKADEDPVTAIRVEAVTTDAETKTARMELSYLSTDLYNSFNGTELRFYTMAEAGEDARVSGAGDYLDVKKEEQVAFDSFAGSEKLHVVVTETALRIQTSGTIQYLYGENTVIDDDTVVTGDGLSVIVFK